MVPAAQYRALNDALNGVTVNAQAIAAADLAIGTVSAVRDRFSSDSPVSERRWAAQELDDAVRDVQRYRGPLAGRSADPVDASSWDDLRHAIGRSYNAMWNIEDVIGVESEWSADLAWMNDTIVGTIEALPGVIRESIHFTAGLATDTVGGVAAGLLPLWPIVAVVAAVVVAGALAMAVARKQGLVK